MKAYFDTSVVAKCYLSEPNSAAALSIRRQFKPPIFLTHLHRVELAAGLQLKVFRKEISPTTATQVWTDLQADIAHGLWLLPSYDLISIYDRAEKLAERYSAFLGTRALDVLHVAAALELKQNEFVTADGRQARLAEANGFSVTRL